MIYIFLLPIIFMSVVLHEVAHGFTAYILGDDTAKRQNRLSFNPIHHIDKFGTIMLPALLLIVSGGKFSFGYAKPVPINPYNFKDFKKGSAITAAAGPATNFVIASFFAIIIRLLISSNSPLLTQNGMFTSVLFSAVYINLFLMFLNLLPFPPLDGSKIVG
ncbi:MAG: site-2 protease family protein, partial [Candidatus Cloacimonadota bacterium]|nr:site-2 protease family protein [Candidatus Cloacimonadota bacterium]